jgi:purine-nucleoside phosphorylase
MSKPIFQINKRLKETYDYLSTFDIPQKVDFGLILGSFLEKCIEFLPLQDKITLEMANVPHMLVPKIPGHGRTIVCGKLENKTILIFCGRLHLYEGYDMREVVYPVSLLSHLSAANLIVTNSAGGINPGFAEDDIMIIKDHINLMADNPFFGSKYDTRHDYFIDMSCPYDKRLTDIAIKSEKDTSLRLKQGIYAGVKGPVLETNAEINAMRKLGIDAVGMSTVPEVTMANFLKIKVLGLSHIRNIAGHKRSASGNNMKFSHIEGYKKEIFIGEKLAKLIVNILKKA